MDESTKQCASKFLYGRATLFNWQCAGLRHGTLIVKKGERRMEFTSKAKDWVTDCFSQFVEKVADAKL